MSKHTREEKKGGKFLDAYEPTLMKLYEDSYKEWRQGKRENNTGAKIFIISFFYNYHCHNNIYLHQWYDLI